MILPVPVYAARGRAKLIINHVIVVASLLRVLISMISLFPFFASMLRLVEHARLGYEVVSYKW